MNSSTKGTIDNAPHTQPVNGQSLFWILLTLATAAITQPSLASRYNNHRLFIRSVPFVCLMDGITDLASLYQSVIARRRGEILVITERDHNSRLNSSSATVKLLIIVFGILPQAIKVFSMRGIPHTQIYCTCFILGILSSTLTHLTGICTQQSYTPLNHSRPLRAFWDIYFQISDFAIGYGVWGQILAFEIPMGNLSPTLYLSWSLSMLTAAMLLLLIVFPTMYILHLRKALKPRFNAESCFLVFAAFGLPPLVFSGSPRATPAVEQVVFTPQILMFLAFPLADKICVKVARLFVGFGTLFTGREHGRIDVARLQTSPIDHTHTHTEVSVQSSPTDPAPVSDVESGPKIAPVKSGWISKLHAREDVSDETADLSFGIYMFMITSIYYLAIFDGTGATCPEWLRYLGR